MRSLSQKIAMKYLMASNKLSLQGMKILEELANHSSKNKIGNKQNLNELQQVLEAIGFTFTWSDQVTKLNQQVPVTPQIKKVFNYFGEKEWQDFYVINHYGHNNTFVDRDSVLSKLNESYEDLVRTLSLKEHAKKPKNLKFGDLAMVLMPSKDPSGFSISEPREGRGNGLWNGSIYLDLYIGVKKITVLFGGKKITQLLINKDSDLDNFDCTKILSTAMKKANAVTLAKNYLDILLPKEVGEVVVEEEKTLLERGFGTCQYCGQVQTLKMDGTLYKHGYKLNTDIFHWSRWTDDCRGSLKLPYEKTCDDLKKIKNDLIHELHDLYENEDLEVRDKKRIKKTLENQIKMCEQKIRDWKPQA